MAACRGTLGGGCCCRRSLVASCRASPACRRSRPPPVEPTAPMTRGGSAMCCLPARAGADNAPSSPNFEAQRHLPPHWPTSSRSTRTSISASPGADQRADPGLLQGRDVRGARPATSSRRQPRPGVTIVRDRPTASPTSPATRAPTRCSAPATRARQDRLFLMDVLRHTGRAELARSSAAAGNRAMDRAQWRPRRTPKRTCRSRSTRRRAHGAEGAAAFTTSRTTSPASTPTSPMRRRPDLSCPPSTPRSASRHPWTVTDVIAMASLIGGIFGKGGGNELRSALMQGLAEALRRPGGAAPGGTSARKNDPEAPTTVRKPLPLRDRERVRQAGPRAPGSRLRRRPRRSPRRRGAASRQPARNRSAASSMRGARRRRHASNWELVAAQASTTGHPIGVLGPQVGYYVAADPHGGGPPRPGHRRARRDLPRRQPLRPARPRPRLRLERDHRDLGQRRHLRRGPLPGRLPLPLQGRVPADGEARAHERWTPNAVDSPRPARDPDRLPHRPRDRLRARQGRAARRSPTSRRAPPTSTRPTRRSSSAHLNDPGFVTAPQSFRRPSRHQLRLQLGLHRPEHIAYQLSGVVSAARAGHLARLPDPRHRRVRLAGLRPSDRTMADGSRSTSGRTRSTRPTSSPGTTSRRRAGRPPTTSTPTARSTARR